MILPNNIDIGTHKKIVFVGESGSGKTEFSMNLACEIRRQSDAGILFLDMDQTKPMFRARDAAEKLRNLRIDFPVVPQMLDAPVVPHGVLSALADPDSFTVMDIGGNKSGALCLGQFSAELRAADPLVFYTIDPFRCFSDSTQHIRETMEMVLSCCGLPSINIAANPYLGPDTTVDDFKEGLARLEELLIPLGKPVHTVLIPFFLFDKLKKKNEVPGRYTVIQPFMSQVIDINRNI